MGKKYRKEKRKTDKAQTSYNSYKFGKVYYFLAIFVSVVTVLGLIISVTAQTP
ncbi:MAG: hypothetical protein HW384_1673 [Dehalococcoidia bacterium]|nr:hypothetical protein [Dehalococcoidia bacterium]